MGPWLVRRPQPRHVGEYLLPRLVGKGAQGEAEEGEAMKRELTASDVRRIAREFASELAAVVERESWPREKIVRELRVFAATLAEPEREPRRRGR